MALKRAFKKGCSKNGRDGGVADEKMKAKNKPKKKTKKGKVAKTAIKLGKMVT